MSDEQRHDDHEPVEPNHAGATPDAAPQSPAPGPAPADTALPPGEALAKGLGLLFQAALGTASVVKESVEHGTVHRNISEAGRHLEGAATAALRGLEQLVRTVGRPATGGGAAPQGSAPPTAPSEAVAGEPVAGEHAAGEHAAGEHVAGEHVASERPDVVAATTTERIIADPDPSESNEP